MDYDQLLEKAQREMPQTAATHSRFEMPKIRGHIQGNKTVISNFLQITSTLRRKPEHLLKYILRGLATPGEIQKNLVIFGRKVSSAALNEKIEQYAKQYVLCAKCGKPDTELLKEGNLVYLHCNACAQRHVLKGEKL